MPSKISEGSLNLREWGDKCTYGEWMRLRWVVTKRRPDCYGWLGKVKATTPAEREPRQKKYHTVRVVSKWSSYKFKLKYYFVFEFYLKSLFIVVWKPSFSLITVNRKYSNLGLHTTHIFMTELGNKSRALTQSNENYSVPKKLLGLPGGGPLNGCLAKGSPKIWS